MIFFVLSVSFTGLLPPEPLFTRPPHTNRPYHITLAWIPNNPSYAVYRGTNGFPYGPNYPNPPPLILPPDYTRQVTVTTWMTESNLWANTVYQFQVVGISNSVESDYSIPPLLWPPDPTNYFNLFLGTNLTIVETNTPDLSHRFYRALLNVSSNSIGATIQASPDLSRWTNVPGLFVFPNKPDNRVLNLTVTNNVDAFWDPD